MTNGLEFIKYIFPVIRFPPPDKLEEMVICKATENIPPSRRT